VNNLGLYATLAAGTATPDTQRWAGVKEDNTRAGKPHKTAKPVKKAKRKLKQASRRKNRRRR